MREIIILDQDDLVRLCAGAEVTVRMNDDKRITLISEESFNKKHHHSTSPIQISEMDIQKEGGN